MRTRYLLAAAVVLVAACQSEPTPTGTAITDVTIIDAVNGVRENQTVVFDGDAITSIQAADIELNTAETIDGRGKFLIPGLWDFHVHLTYDDRFTDSMSELFLSWGITSVRDTGGLLRNVLPVVEKMRAEGALAPRVWYAGPLLDGNFVVYSGDGIPEIGVQNATPADARAMITSLKEQGVGFIKIYEMVSPQVFAEMVEVANELELPIDSHVPLSMRASTAGPLVDSIEHLRNIEMDCASDSPTLHEERLERLKNPEGLSGADLRGSLHRLQRLPAIANYDEARCDQTLEALGSTTQVPTLRLVSMSHAPPYLRDDWQAALSRLPAEAGDAWRESTAGRGVPIGAGTDTPIALAIPGYSLHSELEFLVRAGLSPLEAIESATVRPAEYFSLQDEMGSIDVGKKADMVLLNANPLDDISNTKKISAVVTKGVLLNSEDLKALVQTEN
jgi:hypothetical protein